MHIRWPIFKELPASPAERRFVQAAGIVGALSVGAISGEPYLGPWPARIFGFFVFAQLVVAVVIVITRSFLKARGQGVLFGLLCSALGFAAFLLVVRVFAVMMWPGATNNGVRELLENELGILIAVVLGTPFGVFCGYLVECLRARRRYPEGCCQTCGYNLTGNVSGTCPECGIQVNALT